jgi:putative N6-adenine-specific DNA methylase
MRGTARSARRTLRYFATTARGLETVLAGEIAGLGGKDVAVSAGGVSFAGDPALGYRANLWLRTAGRVLLHLADFPAPTPEALYKGARAVPWPDLFPSDRTVAVDATVRESRIAHARYVELKVKDAVADRFRGETGRRPSVDPRSPDVRIHARIVGDLCTLSLDTSGESLNRRGYRTEAGEAPLRETVAAGIVLLTGWDGGAPLADPACGSGTIPIEAALIATGTAPGLLRRSFGFQRLAGYDRRLWEALCAEARERVRRTGLPRIAGCDVSPAAVRLARRNAARSGIAALVAFEAADIRDFAPGEPPGVIVCNPPYGLRAAGEPGIGDFYKALGDALKKRCKGWTAWLLSGNPEATRHLGLKAARKIPVMNGPIDCRLLKYELY